MELPSSNINSMAQMTASPSLSRLGSSDIFAEDGVLDALLFDGMFDAQFNQDTGNLQLADRVPRVMCNLLATSTRVAGHNWYGVDSKCSGPTSLDNTKRVFLLQKFAFLYGSLSSKPD